MTEFEFQAEISDLENKSYYEKFLMHLISVIVMVAKYSLDMQKSLKPHQCIVIMSHGMKCKLNKQASIKSVMQQRETQDNYSYEQSILTPVRSYQLSITQSHLVGV